MMQIEAVPDLQGLAGGAVPASLVPEIASAERACWLPFAVYP